MGGAVERNQSNEVSRMHPVKLRGPIAKFTLRGEFRVPSAFRAGDRVGERLGARKGNRDDHRDREGGGNPREAMLNVGRQWQLLQCSRRQVRPLDLGGNRK